jgi:hypothetical protein
VSVPSAPCLWVQTLAVSTAWHYGQATRAAANRSWSYMRMRRQAMLADPPGTAVYDPMSAVLVAAFSDHSAAERVRTRLVQDGFPTDRVQLTSTQDLGQAKLVPRASLGEKLTEYFGKLFQAGSGAAGDGARSAGLFQRAVLEGKAAIAVQPRGDVETRRARQLLNEGDPVELRGADLENQTLEHAAAETETPILTWMGKVLAAPGAHDTTGLPKLP